MDAVFDAWASSGFPRRARVNAQRMDIGLHQIAERRIHDTMTGERRLPLERGADHLDAKMTATIARTGVTNVAMAFVLDDQLGGRECREQACADLSDAIAQGSTLRNGRTSTCE